MSKAHSEIRIPELLTSERCIEVHLSLNDGRADLHVPLRLGDTPWWWSLMRAVNPSAVWFYEGNESRPDAAQQQLSARVGRASRQPKPLVSPAAANAW